MNQDMLITTSFPLYLTANEIVAGAYIMNLSRIVPVWVKGGHMSKFPFSYYPFSGIDNILNS